MLQKGFLMENRNIQENKKSRAFIMWGGAVCFVIGVAIIMFVEQKLTAEHQKIGHIVGLGLMGIGGILMCIGLWKNVMAQNKKHRQSRKNVKK